MKRMNFIQKLVILFLVPFSGIAQPASENYHFNANIKELIGDDMGAASDYSVAAGVYYRKACRLDSNGNATGAMKNYDLAIELDPDLAAAWYGRAVIKDNTGDYKSALADLDKALALDDRFVAAYLERGHVKNHLDDSRGAVRDYNKALKIEPRNVVALTNRGAIRQNNGKSRKAMKDYNAAIKINPEYILAYFNRGLLEKKNGYTARAISDFDAALAISRMNEVSVTNVCGTHAGDYMNSGVAPGKAIDLSPKLAAIYVAGNPVKVSSCNNEESLPDMTEILRADKKNPEAYFKRGIQRMEAFAYKEAINDFSRTIDLDTSNYFAYLFRGDMKCHSGDYWGAIDDYSKAIALNPKFSDAWQNRGTTRLLIKQREKACMDLSKAGELGCSNVYQLIIRHCNH